MSIKGVFFALLGAAVVQVHCSFFSIKTLMLFHYFSICLNGLLAPHYIGLTMCQFLLALLVQVTLASLGYI